MNDTNRRAKILAVDDEPVTLALVEGILEREYVVLNGAQDADEGLRRIRDERPDLVLTDIVMPGMSGFELCRALKEDESTRDIPVLFLSGALTMEEFLNGHDVGGEDFLAKPFQPAALRLAVAHSLHIAQERQQLAQDARMAFSTAMVAMSSAGEFGVVLNFIRNSYGCRDYNDLANLLVAACGEFGLSACVRLNGRMGNIARNRDGASSALENNILERLSGFGRIVDFSHRTAVSFPHGTVMITNMPKEDEERYGRLRDHLAILMESADARVQSLDDSLAMAANHETLMALVRQTQEALADIDRRHRDNQNDARIIMHTMLGTVEQSFAQLGLTTAQEDFLADVLRQAVEQVMDLFNQGLAIDNHLTAVKNMLDVLPDS